MKDKDLEVFEKWLEIEFGNEVDKSRSWTYEKSIFRFACEYKEAENKKLREVLEFYADIEKGNCDWGMRVREVLKEVGN